MNTGETIALIKAFGNGGGGSGSLPSVTSSDNGKVLAVKDGAWAADTNTLNVTYASSTLSHTYAEIVAAMDAGMHVILTYSSKRYVAQYYSSSRVVFAYQDSATSAVDYATVSSANAFTIASRSLVPTATTSDNGCELIIRNNAWTKQQKKFIVTLTPTALDYSGTMDKTVAEINAAYEAGQEIWFKVYSETGYDMARADVSLDVAVPDTLGFTCLVEAQGYLVKVYTSNTASSSDYYAVIYSLTPAS